MSADDVARRAARAMLGRDRCAEALGIALVEVAAGRATLRMAVRADMVNGHGICHGGIVFTLADTAFAVACNSHDETTVAAGAGIEFLAPAREGAVLTARCEQRALAGRSGVYDAEVTAEDGTLVAVFRGRSRTVGGRVSGQAGGDG